MLTTATGSVTIANTALIGASRNTTAVMRILATIATTRSDITAAIPTIITAMDDGTRVSITIDAATFTNSRSVALDEGRAHAARCLCGQLHLR